MITIRDTVSGPSVIPTAVHKFPGETGWWIVDQNCQPIEGGGDFADYDEAVAILEDWINELAELDG